MRDFEQIRGTWVHALPWDSDDVLAEYKISGSDRNPTVEAIDTNDGEVFEISDVQWSEGTLSFKSFMPSTGREGRNEFTVDEDGNLRSKFTFTVYEKMQRKNT